MNMKKNKKKMADPMAGSDYPQGGDGAVPEQPMDGAEMDPGMDPAMAEPAEPPVAPADTMMMEQSPYVSTQPAQMMAAIQQLMQADHERLAQEQMMATAGLGQMMVAAVQKAQGMAQSIDAPGGMMARG
jgi:hypothetical protein